MADDGRSRIPYSPHMAPETEEVHLLDPQTTDDIASPLSRGGLHSSSPIFGRHGYQPMPSGAAIDLSTLNETTEDQYIPHAGTSYASAGDPLGVSMKGKANRNSLTRVPVGSKSSSPATPRSSRGLLSSPASGTSSSRNAEPRPATLSPNPDQRLISPLQSPLSSPSAVRPATSRRETSMPWDDPPKDAGPWHPSSIEAEGNLGRNTQSKDASGQRTKPVGLGVRDSPTMLHNHAEDADPVDDDETFYKRFSQPPSYCDSRTDIHRKGANWLSISIIALSIYSTGLSCLWFVVAIVQPRWGPHISSSSGIIPSTASMVCAMFAKTIEISFVTVFVSFIGQVLTRRSFVKKSEGMTLAEMTMRNWVIQPGFLITHWETLPYAGATFLGVVSLVATVASTFYTTASDAMVTPKLKFGDWESKLLQGYVVSSYANNEATEFSCPTPLRDMDEEAAPGCLDVQYAGQSYRNLMSFLTAWDEINRNGTGIAVDMTQRPVGTTLLYDNTTLTSTWVKTEFSNSTAHFEATGRVINNVTLAMPHPGVYDAATHPVNRILQPNDLSGVGEYNIKASVVSPVINVMCVNMNREDLAPLVYTEWEFGKTRTNATEIENQVIGHQGWEKEVPVISDTEWLNRTNVDDIFRWGEEYGRRPPVFQLFPADYNMITNASVIGGDALYLMAKSPQIEDYTLCELRSWVTPFCSTQFDISGTAGSHMRAHCEDPDDPNSYIRSVPDVSPETPDKDWRHVADRWRLSMDINGGTTNSNASNARALTQFVLGVGELDPLLPSMAEALAVFASSTLVTGSHGSPFVHYWEHESPRLGEPGVLAGFNASIRTQEYTSSHESEWQKMFYVVLALVLVINVFCLGYFLSRSGVVTDYTEPQNLFALAVNSPPSEQIKGSCGGGPVRRDLVVPWRVAYAQGANHYFFQEANDRPWRGKYAEKGLPADAEYGVRERSSYKRLSSSRTWL